MKIWRIGMLVLLLLAGTIGPVSAQGKKPGGPGTGEQCLLADGSYGTAQIVLDPGHEGSDPGAIDPYGYEMREADLNLDIAYQAMGILQGAGYTVALTRYGDTYLENSQRGAIANACKALVFVEIHLNASSDQSVNYSQAFWGKKRKDLQFTEYMTKALAAGLDPVPNAGVGQFANGVLLHAEMPSTLVEAVFLTNRAEADALQAGIRQGQIANTVANGIVAFLNR